MTTCSHIIEAYGQCKMEAGHRGRHSTVVFCCDGCGKTRRGTPAVVAPDGGGDDAGLLYICFMCAPPRGTRRWAELMKVEWAG